MPSLLTQIQDNVSIRSIQPIGSSHSTPESKMKDMNLFENPGLECRIELLATFGNNTCQSLGMVH